MKKMRFLSVALLSVLAIGALTGCNDDSDSAVTISVDNAATVVVGETLELPYTVSPEKAKIEVLNDHEEYVTAEAEDGVLSLTGIAEGSATILLAGTYKKYTEANVNISVDVISEAKKDTEPGVPDTGDGDGDDDGGDGGDTGTSGIVALKEGDEATAVTDPGNMYVWADHYDGVEIKLNEAYLDTESALYHIDYEVDTVNSSAQPVWYALQASLQLTEEELLSWGLADGDEYTISFSITSTVAGTITINDVEVAIEQAGVAQEITITSAYRVGAVRAGAGEGEGNRATFWLVAGAQSTDTFLGNAVIEFSGITFAKTETSDTTEAITQSALDLLQNSNDGMVHYYTESYADLITAVHDLETDTYVFEWDSSIGTDTWAFQIMWMLTEEQLAEYNFEIGDYYTLSFTLESDVAHKITVLGDTVDIVVGTNTIEVIGNTANWSLNAESGGYCSLNITASGDGELITSGKFTLSNINFEYYEIPSGFDNDLYVDFSTATLHTQTGEAYDSTAYNTFERWSAESSWGMVQVNVTDSLSSDGYTATISTAANALWYGYQLFYQGPENGIPSGTTYYVRMTITVDIDCTVTINQTETALTAGENELTIMSGHKKGDMNPDDSNNTQRTDLEFQAGTSSSNTMVTSLTLTISKLSFHWNNSN